MIDDIYADLDDFSVGQSLEELQEKNNNLTTHINALTNSLEKATKEVQEIKKENATLQQNISKIYNTAKAEFERKNRLINELRTQVDVLISKQKATTGYKIPKRQHDELNMSDVPNAKKQKLDDVEVPKANRNKDNFNQSDNRGYPDNKDGYRGNNRYKKFENKSLPNRLHARRYRRSRSNSRERRRRSPPRSNYRSNSDKNRRNESPDYERPVVDQRQEIDHYRHENDYRRNENDYRRNENDHRLPEKDRKSLVESFKKREFERSDSDSVISVNSNSSEDVASKNIKRDSKKDFSKKDIDVIEIPNIEKNLENAKCELDRMEKKEQRNVSDIEEGECSDDPNSPKKKYDHNHEKNYDTKKDHNNLKKNSNVEKNVTDHAKKSIDTEKNTSVIEKPVEKRRNRRVVVVNKTIEKTDIDMELTCIETVSGKKTVDDTENSTNDAQKTNNDIKKTTSDINKRTNDIRKSISGDRNTSLNETKRSEKHKFDIDLLFGDINDISPNNSVNEGKIEAKTINFVSKMIEKHEVVINLDSSSGSTTPIISETTNKTKKIYDENYQNNSRNDVKIGVEKYNIIPKTIRKPVVINLDNNSKSLSKIFSEMNNKNQLTHNDMPISINEDKTEVRNRSNVPKMNANQVLINLDSNTNVISQILSDVNIDKEPNEGKNELKKQKMVTEMFANIDSSSEAISKIISEITNKKEEKDNEIIKNIDKKTINSPKSKDPISKTLNLTHKTNETDQSNITNASFQVNAQNVSKLDPIRRMSTEDISEPKSEALQQKSDLSLSETTKENIPNLSINTSLENSSSEKRRPVRRRRCVVTVK